MRLRRTSQVTAAAETCATQVGCLRVPDFFVAVERARNPLIAGRPLAIGRRAAVAFVSREARACGAKPGMPMSDVSERCPESLVVPGRIEPYLETVALADEALWRVGLSVAWHGFSECLFEPTTPATGPGSLRRLAESAMAGVAAATGVEVSCGVADTVVAARAAARLAEPRGLVQVLPGYDARFLSPLAVQYLDGIDEVLAARLCAREIAHIGRLGACHPEELRDSLGRAAGPLVELARGHDSRHVCGRPAPLQFVRTAAVPPASSTPLSVGDLACALAEDLELALSAAGWMAGTMTLRRYGVDSVVRSTVSVSAGSSGNPLREAVRSALATRTASPVVRVTVVASRLKPGDDARRGRQRNAKPARGNDQPARRRWAG